MSDRVLTLVHYYAREGYYRQVQTVCNEVLKTRSGDPVLIFWRAFGMAMEGNQSDVRTGQGAGEVHMRRELRLDCSSALATCRPCGTSNRSKATQTWSLQLQQRS
jgi:hypothetical protein